MNALHQKDKAAVPAPITPRRNLFNINISNLAPLVAATLHERVVHDLNEENQDLHANMDRLRAYNDRLCTKGPSWTVKITGAKVNTVYATGKLLLYNTMQGEVPNYVALEEGAATCRVEELSECRLVLTTTDGFSPDKVYNISDLLDQSDKVLSFHIDSSDRWIHFGWRGDFGYLDMAMSRDGRLLPLGWSEDTDFDCLK